MEHYICIGGCRGVSEVPGVCQADECQKHGHPLEVCECTDGKHGGVFEGVAFDPEEKQE